MKKTHHRLIPVWVQLYCLIAIVIISCVTINKAPSFPQGNVLSDTTTSTQSATTATPPPTDYELLCRQKPYCFWTGTTCSCQTTTTTPTPLPNSSPTPISFTTTTTTNTTATTTQPTTYTPKPSPTSDKALLCQQKIGCTWTNTTCVCVTPTPLPLKNALTSPASIFAGTVPPPSPSISPLPSITTALQSPPILSDEAQSCLIAILGIQKVDKLNQGAYEPTQAEKEQTKSCFTSAPTLATAKQIPPPPQQALLAQINSNETKILSIKKEKITVEGKEQTGIKIEGNGPPNAIVYVYIYSDPIMVSVQTDANGKWSYVLNNKLDSGDHKVYVATTSTNQELVRSEVLPFSIVPAAQAANEENSFDIVTNQSQSVYNQYLTLAALVSVVGILLGALIIRLVVFNKTNSQAS